MELTKVITLTETLEHLKELADKGMYKSAAFDQAHDCYIQDMSLCVDFWEIQNAINYLEEADSVGMLNLENMIEQLERRTENLN